MESTFQFPSVAASDPSDVAVAIETANALWRRGEPQESLRWLRRAADSAEAEGDDMRALSLARAAADMQEEMRPSAPPPASRAPVAARPAGPPPLRSATPAPASSASPQHSATPAPRSAPPPLPSSPASATPAPRSAPPPLPSSPASATPPPRSATPPPLGSASPARSSVPPAPKLEPWRPPAEPVTPVAPVAVDAVAAAPVAIDRATGVVAMESKAVQADVRAAVRVSVETFSKGNRTYIVRVLGEGEAAPSSAREAFLIPTGRDVDFASGG